MKWKVSCSLCLAVALRLRSHHRQRWPKTDVHVCCYIVYVSSYFQSNLSLNLLVFEVRQMSQLCEKEIVKR